MIRTVQPTEPAWFVTLDEAEAELFERYGQPIDLRPGYYYVTVIDGDRASRLRGPFTSHVEAIRAVPAARRQAMEWDRRAFFYGFGTCWSETDLGPGLFDRKEREGC